MTPAEANEQLKRAYALTFGTEHGKVVLADLMMLCRFRTHADTREEEGARRVFLHIMNFMNLPLEQIAALYRGGPVTIAPKERTHG